MKIQVQQSDLVRALSAVASVVSNKTTLPILSTILFDAESEAVTLAATDLDVSVVTRVEGVKVGKAGRIAVPASRFVAFTRTLGPEKVEVKAGTEKVTVQAGRARFEESLMSADEFPTLPKVADDQSFEIDSDVLCEMISSTIYAISRDETRAALQGVLWELRPGAFTMVATDGHRLARVRRAVDLPVKAERKIIASSSGLQQVLRLAEGTDTVKVYLGEHQLSFEIGSTTVHTRLVEGMFPSYEQVIPKSNSHRAICDRQTLADRIRRVKISADRVTNQVRFELQADSLALSASGTEGSHAEDELKVDYAGEPLIIGFNHNYVEDVLKHMGSENVVIALERADSAAIFLPGEDPTTSIEESDDLCLLMPLRLND